MTGITPFTLAVLFENGNTIADAANAFLALSDVKVVEQNLPASIALYQAVARLQASPEFAKLMDAVAPVLQNIGVEDPPNASNVLNALDTVKAMMVKSP